METKMETKSVIEQAVEALYEKLEHPGLDVEGRKILGKLREAQYNPGDIQPLADCMLALLLAGRNAGFKPQAMFDALERLAAKALAKDWKKMPDGTFQAM